MNRAQRIFRRALISASGCLALAALAAPTASADYEIVNAGVSVTDSSGAYSRKAGAHPDFTFSFTGASVTEERDGIVVTGPKEAPRDVDLDLPAGMVGNPTPFPTCTMEQLVGSAASGNAQICPVESQVGKVKLRLFDPDLVSGEVGLFSLEHGPDVPALFGFNYLGAVSTITPRIRPGEYAISAGSFQISEALPVTGADVIFWGFPANPIHDEERQGPAFPFIVGIPFQSNAPKVPFFTNPTACPDEASSFMARGDSWETPGIFDEVLLTTDKEGNPFVWEGCETLTFEPTLTPVPGTHRAHSPTGLDVNIDLPSNDGVDGFSASAVKKTVIEFPQGMTVSPSAVAGLEACSIAQAGFDSNDPPTCPDGSKLGNVTIETQLLPNPLQGDVYLAKQKENPFGATFAIYLMVKGPGFYLKLPGELNLNQENGQLRAIFDDLPQLPFENVRLDFRGGPTAPLVTPNKCGDYSIKTEVFPWARPNDPVVASVPMPIDEACAGGGEFNPRLQAGVENPVAGARSPLTIRITRQDGEQNISQIEVTLPKGEIANLKGLEVCSNDVAPSGNCPAGSQVGIATTAIGTGAFPLFVPQPGKDPTALYLAGPYKGAPYSLVTKVPAQAGPFDFGDIVVRTAIDLNPVTAQVIAKSDPLPQILEGVPIAYRDVRIEVKKPDFSVNPTSCEQRFVTTTITSVDGTEAHPSVPTKVGDCGALNFGPKLKFKVKGGTNRGDFQALTAVLTTGKKEANISKVQVALPHAFFLEQGHIGTVCTRVQFAAENCPEASVYGFAKAITPLLDDPLEGPVYLRSSNNPLPDLVADLQGQFDIELAGRIDSENGGIRNTFETVPDAPVTRFVLRMKGGKKSLLVNSRNLCISPARAKVRMVGQNGKRHNEKPLVQTSCGKKSKKK